MDNNAFQMKFDAMMQAAQAAQAQYQRTGSEESGTEWFVQCLEIGNLLQRQGDYPGAEKIYSVAAGLSMDLWDTFRSANALKRVLDSSCAMGTISLIQRRLEDAQIYFQRGLECYQELLHFDVSIQMRDIRNYYLSFMGLGELFQAKGDHAQAEQYYEQGMRICRDLRQEHYSVLEDARLMLFYDSLARINQQMGSIPKTKLYYEQCAELGDQLLQTNWQETGVDVPMLRGMALGELASLHYFDREWKEAETCFKRCLPYFQQRLASSNSDVDAGALTEVLEKLGIALQMQGQDKESLPYLNHSLKLRFQLFQNAPTEQHLDMIGLAYYNLAMGSTGSDRIQLAQEAYLAWNKLYTEHPEKQDFYGGRLATLKRDFFS